MQQPFFSFLVSFLMLTAIASVADAAAASSVASVTSLPDNVEPHIAHAYVTIQNAHTTKKRSARAKIAAWKSRATRGLWVDGFGGQAEQLVLKTLSAFDTETLAAAGLPLVASYRKQLRTQLEDYLTQSIEELYQAQIDNLKASSMKKFRAVLLKQLSRLPVEEIPAEHDAALREALFQFDTICSDLQVPSLSLTKNRAVSDMEADLSNQVLTISDSPAAQLKRTQKVQSVVRKEKKPGQKGIDIGLDFVAVVRPDGYGSLQGFAGYQFGGNSFTFGIHNDADDPATIAQNGGVRPAFLRVQPKLRVDVEL
jgi:hypothetical protein